jgi:hypothetical protein
MTALPEGYWTIKEAVSWASKTAAAHRGGAKPPAASPFIGDRLDSKPAEIVRQALVNGDLLAEACGADGEPVLMPASR